jgi:hypothetical protein
MYAAWDDVRAALRLARVIAPAVICVALAAGCGGGRGQAGSATSPLGPSSGASAGIEATVAALRSDDAARAYALLSADVRQQIAFEQFAQQWQASAAERRERAGELEAELRAAPSMGERARVTLADGSAVHLVREGSAWRLESALLSALRTGQPRESLQMFAQALTTHDYDALLRVLTERRRTAISKMIDDMAGSLTRHLQSGADTLEVIAEDRAELRWDDGDVRYEILLHNENGEWRIDDIHIRNLQSEPAAAEESK